jgi:hypothetical protein
VIRVFISLQEIKEFAKSISAELMVNHEENLALEVNEFSYNSFTTPSEYLGEFRILLKKVLMEENICLKDETKQIS